MEQLRRDRLQHRSLIEFRSSVFLNPGTLNPSTSLQLSNRKVQRQHLRRFGINTRLGQPENSDHAHCINPTHLNKVQVSNVYTYQREDDHCVRISVLTTQGICSDFEWGENERLPTAACMTCWPRHRADCDGLLLSHRPITVGPCMVPRSTLRC